jgi:hypothetical protein
MEFIISERKGLMKRDDIIPQEVIENKILFIRNKRVMIDKDLARLYGVETRTLNQAVRRNISRFPEDFTFQLTKDETDRLLRSQIVILKRGQHYKYLPHAFIYGKRCSYVIQRAQ